MTYSLEAEFIQAINDLVTASHGQYVTAVDVANDVMQAGLPIIAARVSTLAPMFDALTKRRELFDNAMAQVRVRDIVEELRAQVTTLVQLRSTAAEREAQRLIDTQRRAFTLIPETHEAYYFWACQGLQAIDREVQPLITPRRRGALSLLPRDAVPDELEDKP
jgi:hypothetical protein